jgi:hypothetical protein
MVAILSKDGLNQVNVESAFLKNREYFASPFKFR